MNPQEGQVMMAVRLMLVSLTLFWFAGTSSVFSISNYEVKLKPALEEIICCRNTIKAGDLPLLSRKAKKDDYLVVDGIRCRGEWFWVYGYKYIISRSSCSGKDIAYTIFRNDDGKAKFMKGFYDSNGDGIFEAIYDMNDRPIPDWVKDK